MAYIDRDTLLEFVKQNTPHINGETTLQCVENAIKEAPTADVQEVKHGQWKKHRDDGDCEYIECSVCREEFYPPNNEFEFDNYPKYCQECGAKMDLKVEPTYCKDKKNNLCHCEDCHERECEK